MKKRILSVMLTVVMLCCLVAVFGINTNAADIAIGSEGNISWVLAADGTLTISGTGAMPDYSSSSTRPSWDQYKDQITSVIVEGSVSSVGTYSFYSYKNISKVDIGGSVKSIGSSAFSSCSAIDSLTLSEGVETIGYDAFYNCENIKKLTVPASATDISDDAFSSCKIEEVIFAPGTQVITCKSSGASSAGPFASSALKKITLPSTVETIERRAFYDSTNLNEVVIPNSVTYIGFEAFATYYPQGVDQLFFEDGGNEPLEIDERAFRNCTISSLVLPERVKTIGAYAFSGNKLTSVHIPENVESISTSSFNGDLKTITVDENNGAYKAIDGILYTKDGKTLVMCPRGRSGKVNIPEGVVTIGDSSFYGCEKITAVALSEGLTTIEGYAFSKTYLTSIHLPSTVTDFDYKAFYNSSNDGGYDKLSSITVAPGNSVYKSVDGILYSADGKTLYMCPRAKTGDIAVIDGVEDVADNAFESCTLVTSIVFPDTLQTLGKNAISGNSVRKLNLSSIVIPANTVLEGASFGSVGIYTGSSYTNITQLTVTSGASSITLTGEDIKKVADKNVASVPTVPELMANATNPFTISEQVDGDKVSYTVSAGQVTLDNESIDAIANNSKVIFDDGSNDLTGLVVATGSMIDKPADPTKSGLTFVGWYKESTCINEWNFDTDTVTEDITLYAKWTFSVSNIDVTGSLVKPYDGEQIKLTAENKTNATYQWYKDTVAITGETSRTLTLDGKIADNGNYYCVITLDGVTAQTNEVTVNISKAKVEFFVEEMSLPLSMVNGNYEALTLINLLQTSGLFYDQVEQFGVTVKYNQISGGKDSELSSFLQNASNVLTVKLGDEQVNGDVTTYPIILNCDPNNSEYIALQTHYDVTFSSNGKFVIKPDAVIEWCDSVVQNEGIFVEYTGSAITPSTDLFTATDGKTSANVLTGGTKGYEFYYMITVEDILTSQRNDYYESLLQTFLTSYTVGDYSEYADAINNPNIYMSKYLEYLVEAELKTLDSEFVSLEHDAGARIVFNYYVKATYSGNDTYFGTESEFVLLTVKPIPLTVKAKDQTIFTNGAIVADVNAIVLEGAILANDESRQTLESALPALVDLGIITIEVNADTSVAGEYTNAIVVKYNTERLTELSGENAIKASMYDITTVNGILTVVDVSDVNSTIKSLQDKIDDLEDAIGNLGTSNDIANQINELSAKITAAQNAINALDDTYATDAELASVKLDLEGKITAAQTALQGKIDDLSAKVTDLTTQLNTANGKIDTNSSDIATLEADVDALKSWQTAAQDAISTLQNLTASQGASIVDLQTAVASLQTAVDAATSNITAAIDRIATLEGKVSALETAKTQLEADIAALQTAVATKADAQALTAAINSLNASITEAKAYAESQDAALKTLLEAADATINSAIDELKERVTNLEDGLTAANGKIDTNSSNIETLKADVDALKSWKAEAQAAIDSLESLSATKAELEAAVTELKAALKTANDNISAAIKRIEDLEGKVEDLEKDAEALEKAVSELKAAMTSTTEALAKEIKDLNTALEAAKKTAAEGDAELKKAIETAETALKAAVGELEGRVAVIESVLSAANANINTNTTDIATLKANIKTIEMLQSEAEKTIKALGTLIGTNEENIAELQTSVTKLQESVYAADTKIAAAEARIAVLEGKVEELEGVKNELQASVANLQAALATKADREAVNNAVAALQASISALQSAQNNYIFADMTLKNELTAAINAAKELAISTAKDLVSQSATELRAAIDKKADSATLEAKAAELAEAIVLAETASKAYADAQDALLKEALDAELLAANELIASLGIRMTDAEAAIDALESAVEVLQKVTADDAQALKDAVASLSQALADAKALAAESDIAIETALGLVISEAQKALEAKISDVQSGLNKAIKDLKAADASNADELKKAIKSIEDAMAAAESARDAADNALESKLTEAQTELTRKIAEVQANLDTAKTELGKAIESGDTALGEKIKELNEALEAAKAATEASDVTLKTELTAKIDEADAAIYALIEKLQKELQESNVELNTAIEEGDDELNTQFIISTSVAGVGVAGNIGLLAWIIISKKRRLF
ncbi:MAG: leucine-rich repeat protein [Clostridia bacterium]|nr:leucine-rich repeat protein [Clostridia bacterium]